MGNLRHEDAALVLCALLLSCLLNEIPKMFSFPTLCAHTNTHTREIHVLSITTMVWWWPRQCMERWSNNWQQWGCVVMKITISHSSGALQSVKRSENYNSIREFSCTSVLSSRRESHFAFRLVQVTFWHFSSRTHSQRQQQQKLNFPRRLWLLLLRLYIIDIFFLLTPRFATMNSKLAQSWEQESVCQVRRKI
jgi:hypothetical protein